MAAAGVLRELQRAAAVEKERQHLVEEQQHLVAAVAALLKVQLQQLDAMRDAPGLLELQQRQLDAMQELAAAALLNLQQLPRDAMHQESELQRQQLVAMRESVVAVTTLLEVQRRQLATMIKAVEAASLKGIPKVAAKRKR
jgi:hypothetical protein